MNFTSCISWIKQGVPKALPDKVTLNEDELKSFITKTSEEIEDAEDEENEGQENGSRGADEYDLEHYDDVTEADENPLSVSNLAVYSARDSTNPDSDVDSDDEDLEIKPSDNLILTGRVEEDCGVIDVYLYNEEEGYLYVHHDLLLPSPPLCFTWLNHEPGEDKPGNLAAIGTMGPIIEVWDMDIVNCLEPAFTLGCKASKKKKQKAKGHKKAVLDLAWNSNLSHILASGSADETVILWDLDCGEPSTKLDQFTGPIQALSWHPTQPHGLLTGCCDKVVRLFDCRTDNTYMQWELPGEVERVIWNHFDPFCVLASSDVGGVHCFDARTQKQLWHLEAHSKEVTGLALSCSCPGLLVTGSMDGLVQIWDCLTSSAPPVLIDEKNLDVGAVYCVQTSPDAPFVISVGGDNKENLFTVWHMEESEKVRERFGSRALMAAPKPEDSMDIETSENLEAMSISEPSTSTTKTKKLKKKK